MSILIKGMEMPTCCEDCPMCHSNAEYDYAYCCVSSAETSGNKIQSDCPLVPVPPHGRLIDADMLEALFWDGQCYYTENIKYKIRNIETTIPAEEGET